MTTTLSEDLLALRELKGRRDTANKTFKDLDAAFKTEQRRLIERMYAEAEAAGADPEKGVGQKIDGISFTPVKLEYGTVQDRQEFVAWALENDAELVEYKERGEQINALARRLLDDNAEFPPGLGFYEREYISMRAT